MRGCAGCVRILLLGKVQIPGSPDRPRQCKEVPEPLISPLHGLWLTFGVCFLSGSLWHLIWFNHTRVRDHEGLESPAEVRARLHTRGVFEGRAVAGNFLCPQVPEEGM